METHHSQLGTNYGSMPFLPSSCPTGATYSNRSYSQQAGTVPKTCSYPPTPSLACPADSPLLTPHTRSLSNRATTHEPTPFSSLRTEQEDISPPPSVFFPSTPHNVQQPLFSASKKARPRKSTPFSTSSPRSARPTPHSSRPCNAQRPLQQPLLSLTLYHFKRQKSITH